MPFQFQKQQQQWTHTTFLLPSEQASRAWMDMTEQGLLSLLPAARLSSFLFRPCCGAADRTEEEGGKRGGRASRCKSRVWDIPVQGVDEKGMGIKKWSSRLYLGNCKGGKGTCSFAYHKLPSQTKLMSSDVPFPTLHCRTVTPV